MLFYIRELYCCFSLYHFIMLLFQILKHCYVQRMSAYLPIRHSFYNNRLNVLLLIVNTQTIRDFYLTIDELPMLVVLRTRIYLILTWDGFLFQAILRAINLLSLVI